MQRVCLKSRILHVQSLHEAHYRLELVLIRVDLGLLTVAPWKPAFAFHLLPGWLAHPLNDVILASNPSAKSAFTS
jgi:hypothetical protein